MKCIEEEIPFELPEGWEWARLGDFVSFVGGSQPAKSTFEYIETPNNIRLVQIRDYKSDKYKTFIPREKARRFCSKSDVMIGRYGPPLFQILRGLEGAYNVALMKAVADPVIMINDYLYYLLQDGALLKMLESLSDRTCGQDGINMFELNQYIVGIPPIDEQERIARYLIDALPLADKLSTLKDDLSELLSQTKSKILDLAIKGRLVPQDPNDEPASVLLERIKKEKEELIKSGKIKRDKKESVIFKGDDNSYYEKVGEEIVSIDNEIPFEIPDSWLWCRGYSCFEGMVNARPQGEFFDYIDIDSIDNYFHCIKEAKHLPVSKAPSRASRSVKNGSVLFSLVRPYLENIALVKEEYSHCIASTGFYICNSNGIFLPEFMFFLMISDYVVSGLNQYMKGDNSPAINTNTIENWLYPVPPIKEQRLICLKLNSVFSLIKGIERGIH